MEGIEPNWDLIFKEGQNEKSDDHPPMRLFNYVSPNYFRTMETPVIAGREFTWSEVHGPRPVAILSESLAREMFGSPQAAIGKRIREFSVWHEVVGVVADVHENGIDQPSPAMVYWPPKPGDIPGLKTLDFARGATFVLRSERAGTEELVSEAQRAVWRVNANLPVASVRTMQETASAVAGADFVHADDAGDCGLDGAGAGSDWNLRSDFVHSVATAAGDWDSAGAGGAAGWAALDVCAVGFGVDGFRCGDWLGRGGGAGAADEVAAVWGESAGSGDVCFDPAGVGGVRGGGELFAGAAGGGGGSGGGAEERVISEQ